MTIASVCWAGAAVFNALTAALYASMGDVPGAALNSVVAMMCVAISAASWNRA
jgi:hypothetical protein